MSVARLVLAAALLAIVAWLIAWRRARPDMAPRWLVAKFGLLLSGVALAAIFGAFGRLALAVVPMWIAALVATVIAVRLWTTRRWLSHPMAPIDAAHEARRLAEVALDVAKDAERREEGGRRHG